MRFYHVAACVTLGALATPACVRAGPSMHDVLSATFRVTSIESVALSPDGTAVAWQQDFHDPRDVLHSRSYNSVYVSGVPAGGPRRITAGNDAGYYDEREPAWSPDGRQVAFLSDARSRGQLQIFIAMPGRSHARQLAVLSGDVANLSWSPDGKRLAFLYIPAARRLAGALAPGARDVGVIGSVVEEQRIALLTLATGAVRLLTPSDTYVYQYAWSPDGSRLAVTYAKGNGDNNWWIAHLAIVDAGTGAVHDLAAPPYQIADPQWSPDGRTIALIGGLMSDFTSTGGDINLVDVQTGAIRNLTSTLPVSAQSLRWNDATSLDVIAHVSGAMHLLRVDAQSGSYTALTQNPESLWSWSTARRGAVVALARASFDDPPELWAGSPAALRPITRVNAGARRLYGKALSLHWNSDGFTAQGWLIYPVAFDPQRSYPMVTMVHGGPSAVSVPSFGNRNVSALASAGYFVFMPNPRGSFGQGEAFTRANVKDFGYGDWRDILAGIDAALKAAPINPNRLGLMGWSYGGYMAMWAETQSTRFKAIVAGAGIVNWQSYYGENKIDQWMIPFFGASVYEDPAVYARSSPITFITRSKTPVLVLQGERDEEVPAPQSFEFWHAMKSLGVPVKLIVYADEGHGPRKIVNQIDILTQTVGWFDRYL